MKTIGPPDSETSNSDPDLTTPVERSQIAAAGRVSAASSEPGIVLEPPSLEPHEPIAVVGLGASMGGIPVLQTLLSGIPAQSGLAFVVVMHLSPDFSSSLAEVLQLKSAIPVSQVTGPVRVQRDHVYVIPPTNYIAMREGELYLTERQKNKGHRVAIDLFFRTLAANYGQRAICAVLSGADSDGVIGLKHVKEQGGITMAQDPDEAECDSMPRGAIETGMVDWVLPAAQMAPRLLQFTKNELRIHVPPEDNPEGQPKHTLPESEKPGGPLAIKQLPDRNDESALGEILAYLRAKTGHDFTHYKRATILRRIARRMQVSMVEDVVSYLRYLQSNPAEPGALLQDLFINVTNFFRDPEAFTALQAHIPLLFAGKSSEDSVRVWTCGCSTGEEAYSVAMLLHEHAEKLSAPPSIQVFATDVDSGVVAFARTGVYPPTIEADVSPARLRRFFLHDHGRYRVRQEVRETVLFAVHDVLRDPPFSRLDFVTCRNLLIYLGREAQVRVLDIFNFALHPGGMLFLGGSESLDEASTVFGQLDKKHRIFVRRALPRAAWQFPSLSQGGRLAGTDLALNGPAGTNLAALGQTFAQPRFTGRSALTGPLPDLDGNNAAFIDRRTLTFADLHVSLLEKYAPPSVIVNENYDIVHLSEHVGQYLRLTGGDPSINLFNMVHPALRTELRTALFCAVQSRTEIASASVALEVEGRVRLIKLHVRPAAEAAHGFILVLFEDVSEAATLDGKVLEATPVHDSVANHLEQELRQLKIQLTATVEQYEASTEELKASNEELQAMNEELRSATEELQTSKEELQAVNEELSTVNNELKNSIDELAHLNSDLHNLLVSTEIGTIFLDRELHLKRFTPRVKDIFNLIPTDMGRPLSDITSKLEYTDLAADASQVLQRLAAIEREVKTSDGRWYLAHLLPYRTLDDRIDGVVVTFVDITERKQAAEAVQASEQQFRRLIEEAPIPVIMQAEDGEVLQLSRSWTELTGFSLRDVSGGDAWLNLAYGKGAEVVRTHMRNLFEGTQQSLDVELTVRSADNGIRHWSFSASSPGVLQDGRKFIVGMAVDITDRKRAEAAGRESEEYLRLILASVNEYAIFSMTADLKITTWNPGAERIFGYSFPEVEGRHFEMLFTPEDRKNGIPDLDVKTALQTGKADDERWYLRKDGSAVYAACELRPLIDGAHGFVKAARDLTAQRDAEEKLRHAHEQLQQAHRQLEARVEERTAELRSEVHRREQMEIARERLLQRVVTTQEEERRRIALEMHDQMGQQLTAILMGLSAIGRDPDSGGTVDKATLEKLNEMATNVMQQMHHLAWELRPPALDNFGLAPALQHYVANWGTRSDIGAEFLTRGMAPDFRLPPDTETALYRIVQESLSNVQRHANATRVSVLLERQDDMVVALVEDNGQGFDIGQDDEGSPLYSAQRLGILGMVERAESVGGSLSLESTPGQGTTVYARVPSKS